MSANWDSVSSSIVRAERSTVLATMSHGMTSAGRFGGKSGPSATTMASTNGTNATLSFNLWRTSWARRSARSAARTTSSEPSVSTNTPLGEMTSQAPSSVNTKQDAGSERTTSVSSMRGLLLRNIELDIGNSNESLSVGVDCLQCSIETNASGGYMSSTSNDILPHSYVSNAPRLGLIPGFDGIRGIGVMIVIVQHASTQWTHDFADKGRMYTFFPSMAGLIDLFFVMSAFLITSLLLQEHRSTGTINFKKFYSRRAIRLLPSSTLCIAAWVMYVAVNDPGALGDVLKEALAALTYVYHWLYPVGLHVVNPNGPPAHFDHFWSLSSEEQFYLGIGIVTLWCIKKNWMRQLAAVLAAAAIYIGYARWSGDPGPWPGSYNNGSALVRGFSLLWLARPDSLMWGVVLAVVNAELPAELSERTQRMLDRVGVVAVAMFSGVLLMASPLLVLLGERLGIAMPYVQAAPFNLSDDLDKTYWLNFGHTASALLSMVFILAMARSGRGVLNRCFGWSPFRRLGRMSYTLYVWHTLWIALAFGSILPATGLEFGPGIVVIPTTILVLVLSFPIYRYIERPLLNLKIRFASEAETLDLNTGKMVDVARASDKSQGSGVV